MPVDTAQLAKRLFETRDGSEATGLIRQIAEAARADAAAWTILRDYATRGSIAHVRTHSMSVIVDGDGLKPEDVEFFRKGLNDSRLRYWSIRGLVRSGGEAVYADLVDFALNPDHYREDRAHAIKCLAQTSGQLFDRELPRDPGHWQISQFRVKELQEWRDSGFPRGPGYPKPPRDAALDQPVTELEKLAARLEQKLTRQHHRQDPADPWNILTVAKKEDLDRIRRRWRLPDVYREFLTRFSPHQMWLYGEPYVNALAIFGAGSLIKAQVGYSSDAISGRDFESWRSDDLVIATDGGDPFVLRLLEGTTEDAPVYWAMSGCGGWDWEKRADSFQDFLRGVVEGT